MSIVGMIIAVIVLAGVVYGLFSKDSQINQQMKRTPAYMKVIGAVIFVLGIVVALLAQFDVIGLGGTGTKDWILGVAGLGLGSVFGLLFATNFYTNQYK